MENAHDVQHVIVDSQSLPGFIGIESEQDFDQRAGLCQGGPGDIVITTNPYEPVYLRYWEALGYGLPYLIDAGPFDPEMALSDLIRTKPGVIENLQQVLNGNSRIEFFHPSSREQNLTRVLNLRPYMNFDFAGKFQQKNEFKKLFLNSGIPTLPFLDISFGERPPWDEVISELGLHEKGYIAKDVNGSGGKSLGMIISITCKEDYTALPLDGRYILEPCINVVQEIAVHWEITFEGEVKHIGYFGQIASNLSYIGTQFPIELSASLKRKLDIGFERLTSEIKKLQGLGYMCCDVLVDEDGNIFWSDLNPRKGAIIFIYEAISRLCGIRKIKDVNVVHKHFSGTTFKSFEEVAQFFGTLLEPSDNFILVTNPGAIKHGYLDITAVSQTNMSDAFILMSKIEEMLFK